MAACHCDCVAQFRRRLNRIHVRLNVYAKSRVKHTSPFGLA